MEHSVCLIDREVSDESNFAGCLEFESIDEGAISKIEYASLVAGYNI